MTPLKIMKTASLVSFIALAIAVTLYHLSHYGIFKTLAVAAGTAFYHFFVRLVVGIYIDKVKLVPHSPVGDSLLSAHRREELEG